MVVDGEEKPLDIKKINKQNEELAKDGFRVIALAKSRKIKKVPLKDEILDKIHKILRLVCHHPGHHGKQAEPSGKQAHDLQGTCDSMGQ